MVALRFVSIITLSSFPRQGSTFACHHKLYFLMLDWLILVGSKLGRDIPPLASTFYRKIHGAKNKHSFTKYLLLVQICLIF